MVNEKLGGAGAAKIILIKQEDCSVPVFDTTPIHASAVVEVALKL